MSQSNIVLFKANNSSGKYIRAFLGGYLRTIYTFVRYRFWDSRHSWRVLCNTVSNLYVYLQLTYTVTDLYVPSYLLCIHDPQQCHFCNRWPNSHKKVWVLFLHYTLACRLYSGNYRHSNHSHDIRLVHILKKYDIINLIFICNYKEGATQRRTVNICWVFI